VSHCDETLSTTQYSEMSDNYCICSLLSSHIGTQIWETITHDLLLLSVWQRWHNQHQGAWSGRYLFVLVRREVVHQYKHTMPRAATPRLQRPGLQVDNTAFWTCYPRWRKQIEQCFYEHLLQLERGYDFTISSALQTVLLSAVNGKFVGGVRWTHRTYNQQ